MAGYGQPGSSPAPTSSASTASSWLSGATSLLTSAVNAPSSQAVLAVAGSLWRGSQGMSKWTLNELTVGLATLALAHATNAERDVLASAQPVTNRDELREMLHWLRWAMAAYESDTVALSSDLNIPLSDIKRHVADSSVNQPAYFVALHEARKTLVVAVRGTHSSSDVLTDLILDSCPFQGGFAHAGMLAAARWLHAQLCPKLMDIATSQGWSITVVGHSLGAGTAALFAMLLHEDLQQARVAASAKQQQDPLEALASLSLAAPRYPDLACWAFACPPVVSPSVALSSAKFIHTVVLQHDIVPRLCPEALEELRCEVMKHSTASNGSGASSSSRGATGSSSSGAGSSSGTGSVLGMFATAAFDALASQQQPPAAAAQPAAASGVPSSWQSLLGSSLGAASKEGGSATSSSSRWLSVAGSVASAAYSAYQSSSTSQPGNTPAEFSLRITSTGNGGDASSSGRKSPDVDVSFSFGNGQAKGQGSHVSRRLIVPGIPYHILRHSKDPAQEPKWSVEQLIAQEQQRSGARPGDAENEALLFLKERDGMERRGVATGEEGSAGQPPGAGSAPGATLPSSSYGSLSSLLSFSGQSTSTGVGRGERFSVVKGPGVGVKFGRIVMAPTLLSDHSCKLQGAALLNAMQWLD